MKTSYFVRVIAPWRRYIDVADLGYAYRISEEQVNKRPLLLLTLSELEALYRYVSDLQACISPPPTTSSVFAPYSQFVGDQRNAGHRWETPFKARLVDFLLVQTTVPESGSEREQPTGRAGVEPEKRNLTIDPTRLQDVKAFFTDPARQAERSVVDQYVLVAPTSGVKSKEASEETAGASTGETQPQAVVGPQWITGTPIMIRGGKFFVVGMSMLYTTAEEARQKALENAKKKFVEYVANTADGFISHKSLVFGASAEKVMVDEATRGFQIMISDRVWPQWKLENWYVKQEQSKEGTMYLAFVNAMLPVSSINQEFQQAALKYRNVAVLRAQSAESNQAREKWETAAKLWAKVGEESLLPQGK
jgi:archaellum component FlaF (FlaF/FlaG flagellin family)